MPYKNKADRNYKKEYETYQGTEQQKKNRAMRNSARAELTKEGKVHKNDGQDVDHIKPLSKGGRSGKANLRVKPASANRSFSRNPDHSVRKNSPKK